MPIPALPREVYIPHELPKTIVLRFRTVDDCEFITSEALGVIPLRRTLALACDPKTDDPVMELPMPAMAKWLEARAYRWVTGSSGLWERRP